MRMVLGFLVVLAMLPAVAMAQQRIDPLLEAQAISRAKYAEAREADQRAREIERGLSPGAISYEAIGLHTRAKELRAEGDAAIRAAQLSSRRIPVPGSYYSRPSVYVGPRGHGSVRFGPFRFSF